MQAEDTKNKVGESSVADSAHFVSSSVSPIQQAFIDAAILQNLEQVPQPKLVNALNDHILSLPTARMIRQRLQWTGIFLVLGVYTAFNFSDGTQRLLSFWQSYEKPNPINIPHFGNATVEQANFTAVIGFEGATPMNSSTLNRY